MMEVIRNLITDRAAFAALISGTAEAGQVSAVLAAVTIAGGLLHGFSMGLNTGLKAAIASAIKAPLVPLASLLITLPLLFVVGTAGGMGLSLAQTLALALMPLALTAILLASAAPAFAFFSSTSNYDFLKLLHVAAFAITCLYAMTVLHEALKPFPGASGRVFVMWTLLYGFVGCQMAWALRPFIGDPTLPFTFVRRDRGGMNFYTAVSQSIGRIVESKYGP